MTCWTEVWVSNSDFVHYPNYNGGSQSGIRFFCRVFSRSFHDLFVKSKRAQNFHVEKKGPHFENPSSTTEVVDVRTCRCAVPPGKHVDHLPPLIALPYCFSFFPSHSQFRHVVFQRGKQLAHSLGLFGAVGIIHSRLLKSFWKVSRPRKNNEKDEVF